MNEKFGWARTRAPSPTQPDGCLSRAELAVLVHHWVLDNRGQDRPIDESHIGRFERGEVTWPHPDYRAALRSILGATCDADLGFFNQRRRPLTPDTNLQRLRQLPVTAELSSEALLSATGSGSVSASDVAVIRGMLDALTASDRQFGGGHARSQATGYLHGVVEPRLHARATKQVARDLFGVATELTLRVASMQLDGGQAATSRRLLGLAGSLAHETDDLTLTAWVLARRSEQYAYEKQFDHALAYSAAAATLAEKAPPVVQSFLVGKQALALALTNNKAATLEALRQVRHSFEQSSVLENPSWIGNYGWGHIRHDEALCYMHLGMGSETVAAAEESMRVQGRARFARPRAFSLGVISVGYVHAGEVEMACQVAHELVALAAHLDSARVRSRLVDVVQALAPHGRLACVRDLHDAARPLLVGTSN